MSENWSMMKCSRVVLMFPVSNNKSLIRNGVKTMEPVKVLKV